MQEIPNACYCTQDALVRMRLSDADLCTVQLDRTIRIGVLCQLTQ